MFSTKKLHDQGKLFECCHFTAGGAYARSHDGLPADVTVYFGGG
jgi:hypothetical protein